MIQTRPGPPPGAAVLGTIGPDALLDEDEEVELAAGAGLLEGLAAAAELALEAEAAPALEAASAAYHASIPLWPRQAPCFFGAEVNVPSLHLPVVPAGAPAGAFASKMQGERIRLATTARRNSTFIFTVLILGWRGRLQAQIVHPTG